MLLIFQLKLCWLVWSYIAPIIKRIQCGIDYICIGIYIYFEPIYKFVFLFFISFCSFIEMLIILCIAWEQSQLNSRLLVRERQRERDKKPSCLPRLHCVWHMYESENGWRSHFYRNVCETDRKICKLQTIPLVPARKRTSD